MLTQSDDEGIKPLKYITVELYCDLIFISLRDIKTSLTYVTDYVTDYVPSFSTSNFGALLLYEREGWVQINVNRYWTPGQV